MNINATKNWIDLLEPTVNYLNDRTHTRLHLSPNEMGTRVGENYLKKLYSNKPEITKKFKFKINDMVRISYPKKLFDRLYFTNYTPELYKIVAISTYSPPMYVISDANNNILPRKFYENEILKPKHKDIFLIDRIIKKKNKKVLVKWSGYPDSFNSWIDIDSLMSK